MSQKRPFNLDNTSMANGMSFAERDDAFNAYLKNIRHFQPLTREEEIDLAKKIQSGDEKAFDTFVNHNLLLVVSCARHYMHNGLPVLDLIQYGNIGLMKAVKKYTRYEECRFNTFGLHLIRKEIVDALEREGKVIRNNHGNININMKVAKATEMFLTEHGYAPDEYDLEGLIGEKASDIKNAMLSNVDMVSMDKSICNDDEAVSFGDTISGDMPTDTNLKKEDTKVVVRSLMSVLSEREKIVVKMAFGIDDDIEYSTEIIADRIGLGHERVRQILNASIKKMQKATK